MCGHRQMDYYLLSLTGITISASLAARQAQRHRLLGAAAPEGALADARCRVERATPGCALSRWAQLEPARSPLQGLAASQVDAAQGGDGAEGRREVAPVEVVRLQRHVAKGGREVGQVVLRVGRKAGAGRGHGVSRQAHRATTRRGASKRAR